VRRKQLLPHSRRLAKAHRYYTGSEHARSKNAGNQGSGFKSTEYNHSSNTDGQHAFTKGAHGKYSGAANAIFKRACAENADDKPADDAVTIMDARECETAVVKSASGLSTSKRLHNRRLSAAPRLDPSNGAARRFLHKTWQTSS
jgi:hypothetical protein